MGSMMSRAMTPLRPCRPRTPAPKPFQPRPSWAGRYARRRKAPAPVPVEASASSVSPPAASTASHAQTLIQRIHSRVCHARRVHVRLGLYFNRFRLDELGATASSDHLKRWSTHAAKRRPSNPRNNKNHERHGAVFRWSAWHEAIDADARCHRPDHPKKVFRCA